MKKLKNILFIFFFIMIMPFIVNAKEACSVVSGNGKDIGSEIACGTEHFYVIGKDGNNLKMLSKYNLYVGSNFNKIKLDINNIYIRHECRNGSCYYSTKYFFEGEEIDNYYLWEDRILEKYGLDDIYEIWNFNGQFPTDQKYAIYDTVYGENYTIDGKTYSNTTFKLYPYTSITENVSGFAMQNKLALGVTGEKGNANYPINAVLTLFPHAGGLSSYIDMNNLDNFENGYTNFKFRDDTDVSYFLSAYYENLLDMGFEISNVDMINMKELRDLVSSVTNKNLPLSDWYNNSLYSEFVEEDNNYSFTLGDLKEYLSDDYSWLWNTSYWTKTLVGNSSDITDNSSSYVYFVASSGEVCYSASDCFSGIPRAGIRPVVTMSSNNIKYSIKVKTDGNGTIEVVDSAFGGDTIQFKVTAKKGLKLTGLTITTDLGEKIEFDEEDITVDENGIYSISTNKFTMPFENVTIEAKWGGSASEAISNVLTNPKTGSKALVIVSLMFASIGFGTIMIKKYKH